MTDASNRWSFLGVASERLEVVGLAGKDEVEVVVAGYGDIRLLLSLAA